MKEDVKIAHVQIIDDDTHPGSTHPNHKVETPTPKLCMKNDEDEVKWIFTFQSNQQNAQPVRIRVDNFVDLSTNRPCNPPPVVLNPPQLILYNGQTNSLTGRRKNGVAGLFEYDIVEKKQDGTDHKVEDPLLEIDQ